MTIAYGRFGNTTGRRGSSIKGRLRTILRERIARRNRRKQRLHSHRFKYTDPMHKPAHFTHHKKHANSSHH